MNIFELLFFVLALFLSLRFGMYLFKYIGWWSVIPGGLLGFGLVIVFLLAVTRLFGRRHPVIWRK